MKIAINVKGNNRVQSHRNQTGNTVWALWTTWKECQTPGSNQQPPVWQTRGLPVTTPRHGLQNETLFFFVYKIDKFLFLFYFTYLNFSLWYFKYILSNKSSIFIPESFGITLLKHKQDKSLEVNYLHCKHS